MNVLEIRGNMFPLPDCGPEDWFHQITTSILYSPISVRVHLVKNGSLIESSTAIFKTDPLTSLILFLSPFWDQSLSLRLGDKLSSQFMLYLSSLKYVLMLSILNGSVCNDVATIYVLIYFRLQREACIVATFWMPHFCGACAVWYEDISST